MKYISKILTVFVAFLLATVSYAQQPASVEKAVKDIVKKYDDNNGVSCMTVAKGSGLEMLKMVFNKEFGKEFMKGVTSITIIDYSDSPEATCMDIRKDLDVFQTLLSEFDVSEEKQFSDNDYIRCFATETDSKTISDFVMALEDDKSKVVMYMAGKIVVD